MKRFLKLAAYVVVAIFVLIQFVPYGRDHTNPPVLSEPNWDSPQTRELAVTACFDCHSNQSEWPWYSNVAPISWLVYHDVIEGREHLNYSEWDSCHRESCTWQEARETILNGEMPMPIYLVTHAAARLTDAEKQALITGLQNSP